MITLLSNLLQQSKIQKIEDQEGKTVLFKLIIKLFEVMKFAFAVEETSIPRILLACE